MAASVPSVHVPRASLYRDWALIPDVIDGESLDNDRLISEWPHGKLGVPVWHLHEPVERLSMLADEWPRVAIGSSGAWSRPGTTKWWARMAQAMEALCDTDGNPKCKLHGLRMLSTSIFPHLPLSSADSSTVARKTFRDSEWKGGNQPHAQEIRAVVLAERIEAFQAARKYEGMPQQYELELELYGGAA